VEEEVYVVDVVEDLKSGEILSERARKDNGIY